MFTDVFLFVVSFYYIFFFFHPFLLFLCHPLPLTQHISENSYLGISSDVESRINVLEACTRKIPLSENVSLKQIAQIDKLSKFSGADLSAVVSQALLLSVKKKIYDVDQNVISLLEQKKEERKNMIGLDDKTISSEKIEAFSSKLTETKASGMVDIHNDVNNVEEEGGDDYIVLNKYLDNLSKNNSEFLIPCVNHEDFINAINKIQPSISVAELKHYETLESKYSTNIREIKKR